MRCDAMCVPTADTSLTQAYMRNEKKKQNLSFCGVCVSLRTAVGIYLAAYI